MAKIKQSTRESYIYEKVVSKGFTNQEAAAARSLSDVELKKKYNFKVPVYKSPTGGKPKWARAQKEKYVYDALIKKGVSVKEAQKGRSLSQKTIKERYGLDLKKLEQKQVDRSLRVDPKNPKLFVRVDRVRPVRKSTTPPKTKKEYLQTDAPKRKGSKKSQMVERRKKLWKYYSQKYDEKMPATHKEIAQRTNLLKGFDINDPYGYAVAYYAFVYNIAPSEIINRYTQDLKKFVPEDYIINEKQIEAL